MRKFGFIAFAILLVTACNKQEATVQPDLASNAAAKPSVTRPFEVNFYTTVDTDPSIPPTPCSGDLPGWANPGFFLHGTATHMGQIQPALSRGQDVTCNINFATFLLTTTVAGQIAAADGDLIYYTANDNIDIFNLLTSSGPNGPINGVWTITGGTGRFAGATGSFTISGFADFTTLTLSFTGSGTITY